jgi:hypothetical protein
MNNRNVARINHEPDAGAHRETTGFAGHGMSVDMCTNRIPTGSDVTFTNGPGLLFTTGLSAGIAVSVLSHFDPTTAQYTQRAMIHLGGDDYGQMNGKDKLIADLAERLHPAPHLVFAFGDEYERDYFMSKTWAPAFLEALSCAMEARGKAPPLDLHVLFTGATPAEQQPGTFAVAADGTFGFLRRDA